MTYENNDPTLRRLRRLAVLEPDPARTDRVRMRCRTAIAQRQLQRERAVASTRFTALVLESGLIYGLCVGYVSAIVHDLLRLYVDL